MFLPASIQIGSLQIRDGDSAAAMTIGSSLMIGRRVSGKKNLGFGQQFGDGSVRFATVQLLLDNDGADGILRAAGRRPVG